VKQLAQSVVIFFILILFGCFFVQTVDAASLTNLKDAISTSRPSAASPISADAASGVGQLSVLNNGSYFLASDSAKVIRSSTSNIITQGLVVASQSAAMTTVHLGNTTGAAVQAGTDVLFTPITATHTISFITPSTIPIGGTIVITFPGSANNTASPSATTFAFNNLNNAGAAWNGSSTPIITNNVTCGASSTVTAPSLTCVTTTGAVTAGTTVTIMIGCTAQSGGVCTAASPRLINPTASSTQCSGQTCTAGPTNDSWKVTLQTTDGSNNLDSASTKINTIQSVQVQATVEPTLTFSITGLNNNINLNTDGTYGLGSCGALVTNSGINATATSVNLGILAGVTSLAAQQLSVSTNAANGYVITATSSGQLKNPATGFAINDANGAGGLTANDTPAPATITAGTPAFGIHACGARSGALSGSSGIAAGDIWVNNGTVSTAKFSNPWNTGTNAFYNTIASYTGGPVATDKTNITYGATVSGTTPAGIYLTTLTYVASATF
jgi:hypothetical protein